MSVPARPQAERFWPKVNKTDGCWLWVGAISSTGYGCFFLTKLKGKVRNTLAHRWAYEDTYGPIPAGLELDHLCRNRACVRPDHLEAVSSRANTLRGMAPSAIAARTNICQRGHSFTPENTYWRPDGQNRRQCRACIKLRSQRRRGVAA